MIRYSLLTLFALGLALYAWRDWYKALCGLILLMAVVERPDMPKGMFGVPGLNPWNLLLLNTVLAWAASRRRERLVWDMPRHLNLLLLLYLGVVMVAFVRMMADRTHLVSWSPISLTNDFLINPIKWTIPGLLLFDGCRSRRRLSFGLFSVLAMYLVLALLVIKWVPPRYALEATELQGRTLRVLDRATGFHRVDMSMMLAGASWAMFAAASLVKRHSHKLGVVAASLAVVYAQALTAGRAGYVAWAAVGAILGGLRWRRYLLLAPLVIVALAYLVPGSAGRVMEGISEDEDALAGDQIDENKLTAGRSRIWPYVIEKIGDAPVFGHGRLAMRRTGLAEFAAKALRDDFGHPHNAYLELLLDNGVVGFALIIPFYVVALFHGFRLLRDSRSPVFVATGGVASSLVLALLVASLGSQTFYPREGTVGLWCALGLLFRVSVERSRVVAQARAAARSAADRSAAEREPDSVPRVAPIRPGTTAARARGDRGTPRAGDTIDSRLWAQVK